MTWEHGKCNSFGLWHVQAAVPSSLSKHSCTTLFLRTPRRHLSLHATSNLCCLVPIGLTLCCWALVIFLSMYSMILYPNTIPGLFTDGLTAIVTVPDVRCAPIHDESN